MSRVQLALPFRPCLSCINLEVLSSSRPPLLVAVRMSNSPFNSVPVFVQRPLVCWNVYSGVCLAIVGQ